MERESIVRLFSTILRHDDDGYWLVTPAEKMRIQVEDVPFVVRLMDREGRAKTRCCYCRQMSAIISESMRNILWKYPPLLQGKKSRTLPFRANLKARLSRPVYYELADNIDADPKSGKVGVWSAVLFSSWVASD